VEFNIHTQTYLKKSLPFRNLLGQNIYYNCKTHNLFFPSYWTRKFVSTRMSFSPHGCGCRKKRPQNGLQGRWHRWLASRCRFRVATWASSFWANWLILC